MAGNSSILPAVGAICEPMVLSSMGISKPGGGGGPSDPLFSSTKLLLGFENALVPDESSAARGNATAVGNAQTSSAQFKFGANSGLFDGVGDSFTFANSADFRLSATNADPFTIEAWVRPHAASNGALITFGLFGPNRYSYSLWISGAKQLAFDYSLTGSSIVTIGPGTGPVMTLDTWYYVAVDKDATGKIRTYVGQAGGNASMANSATPGSSAFFSNSTDPLQIGTGAEGDFNGNLDEIRITKGQARYANDAGFVVPIAAFPRS